MAAGGKPQQALLALVRLGGELGGLDDAAPDAEAQLERTERLVELLAPLRTVSVSEALAEQQRLLLQQLERVNRTVVLAQVREPQVGNLPLLGAELGGGRAHTRGGAVELALSKEPDKRINRSCLAMLQLHLERSEGAIELLALARLLEKALVEQGHLLAEQPRFIDLTLLPRSHRLHHPLCRRFTLRLAELIGSRHNSDSGFPHSELGRIQAAEEQLARPRCGLDGKARCSGVDGNANAESDDG